MTLPPDLHAIAIAAEKLAPPGTLVPWDLCHQTIVRSAEDYAAAMQAGDASRGGSELCALVAEAATSATVAIEAIAALAAAGARWNVPSALVAASKIAVALRAQVYRVGEIPENPNPDPNTETAR